MKRASTIIGIVLVALGVLTGCAAYMLATTTALDAEDAGFLARLTTVSGIAAASFFLGGIAVLVGTMRQT